MVARGSKCAVAVPLYNSARYIEETVFSVLNQTMADFQLVIVDDGSTDDSYHRAAQIQDPRIVLFRQENAGVAAARNAALKRIQSDYVLFLDADDRLRPHALSRLSAALDSQPEASLAYGRARRIDEDGQPMGKWDRPIGSPEPSGRVLRVLLQHNFIRCPGAALVRRSAFERTEAFKPAAVPSSDWELWCRLAALGCFARVDDGPIVDYRFHSGNQTMATAMDLSRVMRSVQEVYSNPDITQSFTPRDIATLRRKREASIYAWLATECLRDNNFMRARALFLKSLGRSMSDPRAAVLLLFSLARLRPPWF